MTVARRLARNFGGIGSCRSGHRVCKRSATRERMSSSSATIVASYFAIAGEWNRRLRSTRRTSSRRKTSDVSCLQRERPELSRTRWRSRRGQFGGSEDHTAMLCCKAGRLPFTHSVRRALSVTCHSLMILCSWFVIRSVCREDRRGIGEIQFRLGPRAEGVRDIQRTVQGEA